MQTEDPTPHIESVVAIVREKERVMNSIRNTMKLAEANRRGRSTYVNL